MRILELSGDTGSTDIIARNLLSQLGARGHDVHLISPVRGRWDFQVIRHLITTKTNYDLIHAHLGDASILAGRLGNFFKIPVMTTLHGFQKGKHYRNVHHFTAVSDAVKSHFVAQEISSENITVIPNGYNPTVLNGQAADTLDKIDKKGRFVLGTVGTLSEIKRHDFLLEVMTKIVKERPDALLLIAGDGEKKNALTAQIETLDLAQHVSLIGHVNDISGFYRRLDMYVQGSALEGFCMPVLEAMAFGLPVITTACKGPEEYAVHARNAHIAPVNDVNAYARDVLTYMNNPQEAQKIGAQAALDMKKYTWKNIARTYETLMFSIIQNYESNKSAG